MATPSKKDGPKDTGDTARPSFDARLAQLDQIVLEIDGGKLGLEDSLERYQLGMRLYRELKTEIDAHRRRFEELSADGEIRAHSADDSAGHGAGPSAGHGAGPSAGHGASGGPAR